MCSVAGLEQCIHSGGCYSTDQCHSSEGEGESGLYTGKGESAGMMCQSVRM